MKRMIVEAPVAEQASYEVCKLQALRTVILPRTGTVYRLLNDEYAQPWLLHAIKRGAFAFTYAADSVYQQTPDVYTFEFVYAENKTVTVLNSLRIQCRMDQWPEKVRAGEIVVDGDDLPPGRMRYWAVAKGIKYVLSRNVDRLLEFCTQQAKSSSEALNVYERIKGKEFDATCDDTRCLASVRRAIQRRIIYNGLGAHVHRQLRPKVP